MTKKTKNPTDARYDFIIFRGSDIKDLTVYEDDKRKQDFIDPAVVTAQPARGGKGMHCTPPHLPPCFCFYTTTLQHTGGNNNRQQGGGFNAHNNNNNTHNNNNAHNNQHHGYASPLLFPHLSTSTFVSRKGGNFQHQDKPARGMFDQFNNFDNRRQEPPRHENFGHGQVGGYGGHSGGKDHRGGKGGRVDFQGRGGKGAKGGNFHHNNHHNNHQHHGGNNQHNRHHDNNRRREPHVNPFATHTGTNFKAKDEEEAAEKRKNAGVEEEFNFTDKTMDMTKVKEEAEKEDIKADNGYDKKKSFFDTLSCETTDRGGAKPAEGAEGAPPVGEKKYVHRTPLPQKKPHNTFFQGPARKVA